jgi:hypothetical protein
MTDVNEPADVTRAVKLPCSVGAVWLLGVVPTGLASFFLLAMSDHADDATPGAILAAMAGAGLLVGGMIVWSSSDVGRLPSLVVSALWLVGAVLVYPTQEFAVDQMWAAGIPALVGIVTGALAFALARPDPPVRTD